MRSAWMSGRGVAGLGAAAGLLFVSSAAQATEYFIDPVYRSNTGCGIADAVQSINTNSRVAGCPARDGLEDHIYGPSTAIDISMGLEIRAPMTIWGATLTTSGSIVAGENVASIRVRSNAQLVLSGTTFRGTATAALRSRGLSIDDGGLVTLSITKLSNFNNGAIVNDGTLELWSSTIDGNVTTSAVFSGGITNRGTGDATFWYSTLSNNKSQIGGALRVRGGYVQLFYCTVAHNEATNGSGGGTYTALEAGGTTGELDLTHVTVVYNKSTGVGGGVYNETVAARAASVSSRIQASIVAGNTRGASTRDDVWGRVRPTPRLAFHDGKNRNMFTAAAGGGVSDADRALDIVTTTPRLGPLVLESGRYTATVALLTGSPAIDAGLNSVPSDPEHNWDMRFNRDQRSMPRVFPVNGKHDLGSYEK